MNLTALFNAMPGAIAQGLIWGIMAIGVYITYKVLDLADLTVDGSMATGGAVCVMLMLNGVNVWIALLCAIVAGMLAGLLTGVFHTAMGIPPILAGILTQLSLYSINLAIMEFKANQGINVTKYSLIVSQRNVRLPDLSNPIFIALIFLAAVIGILYWFFGTELGSSLRATGANEAMSRAQGINTKMAKILGLMISNGIVALSSAMLAHYQGFVDVNMGRGAIVIGLAAVIISEVVFGRLFTNFALKLVGVALGAVIYYIVIQIVLWLGLNTNLLKLLSALIVAVFLGIPYWKAAVAARNAGNAGNAGKRGQEHA
jgi:putative ABC transport system permease protein